MANFSTRLKELRKEKDLSQQELANIIKISKSSVNMYERGEREPGFETMESFADFFNVDMDYLMGRQDIKRAIDVTGKLGQGKSNHLSVQSPMTFLVDTSGSMSGLPSEAIPFTPSKTFPIPIVGYINCGAPLFAEDNIEGYIETPIEDITSDEIYFWLRAKGDSMINAGIHEGDLLLIRQQNDVDSGDIAVVAVNGDEATLKRVVKKENALVLQPENPAHETKIFVGNEINEVQIRGRLMELKKKF